MSSRAEARQRCGRESGAHAATFVPGEARGVGPGIANATPAFTESLIQMGSNLDDLRVQHAAAVKAVEAENRKRLDEKKKPSAKAGATDKPNADVEQKGKPVF